MKYKRIASAAALFTILPTAPLQAAPPLQPTSKWTVNFGDAQCTAMRNYGTDAAPIMLAFKPAPIGDAMQVSVLQPASDKNVGQYKGTMTLDAAQPTKISILGFPAPPKTSKWRIHSINLSMAAFDPVRTATLLKLRSSLQLDRTFALSQMAAVAKTLDRCVVDLRRVWNLPSSGDVSKPDGAVDRTTMVPQSEKPLYTYFTSEDYPDVALRNAGAGDVTLMLLVDEKGKLATCSVIEASGLASLDSQSCAIIATRAKFKPGTDASGKPVKSGSTFKIRWQLGR